MKKGLLSCIPALFAAAGLSFAQPPTVVVLPQETRIPQAVVPTTPLGEYVAPMEGGHCTSCVAKCGPRSWAYGEYLYWIVRASSVPPLVTVGNPADALPGALGQPGTGILVNDTLSYRPMSGVRVGFGRWFDNEERFGFEASGFVFERLTNNTNFTDANGVGAGPDLFASGFLLGAEGSSIPFNAVNISQRLQLWGAEANGLFGAIRRDCWSLDLLAGVRYADLDEQLSLNYSAPTITFTDSFRSRNQFYGGQVGAKFQYRCDRWTFDLIGKVGLGNNHRSITIAANPPTGAIFAMPSNIGRTTDDNFSVLPDVKCQVGYNLTEKVRLTLGYNFLYWSDVSRPGNAINRTINATSPPRTIGETDFWAHGVSTGLEFRW